MKLKSCLSVFAIISLLLFGYGVGWTDDSSGTATTTDNDAGGGDYDGDTDSDTDTSDNTDRDTGNTPNCTKRIGASGTSSIYYEYDQLGRIRKITRGTQQ